MHDRLFILPGCFPLVTAWPPLFYGFSKRSLKMGPLRIDNERDRQQKELLSEISNHWNIDVLFMEGGTLRAQSTVEVISVKG